MKMRLRKEPQFPRRRRMWYNTRLPNIEVTAGRRVTPTIFGLTGVNMTLVRCTKLWYLIPSVLNFVSWSRILQFLVEMSYVKHVKHMEKSAILFKYSPVT